MTETATAGEMLNSKVNASDPENKQYSGLGRTTACCLPGFRSGVRFDYTEQKETFFESIISAYVRSDFISFFDVKKSNVWIKLAAQ